MAFKKSSTAEVEYWRNQPTKAQAELAQEKKQVAEINRRYMESRFIAVEEIYETMVNVQEAIGVIAQKVERQEHVNADEVCAIYEALRPLTSDLVATACVVCPGLAVFSVYRLPSSPF